MCLSGSSHWNRRAQRGSCVLPGKRWGWSRAAVAAAAAGAWCGGGDTRSSSSIWRWSPKPTRTLQWVKDQHSHVMVPVELWQNGKKVLMWLFSSYCKIRMFYCTSLWGYYIKCLLLTQILEITYCQHLVLTKWIIHMRLYCLHACAALCILWHSINSIITGRSKAVISLREIDNRFIISKFFSLEHPLIWHHSCITCWTSSLWEAYLANVSNILLQPSSKINSRE